MNIEKLKELRSFEKRSIKLMKIFGIPLLLSVIGLLIYLFISNKDLKVIVVGILMLIIMALMAITSHFGFKEMKYINQEENAIISILKQFLQSEGIPKGSFKFVFNESNHEYLVAFHNQTINYNDLDKKVQTLLYQLNKIAEKNVKVKLL